MRRSSSATRSGALRSTSPASILARSRVAGSTREPELAREPRDAHEPHGIVAQDRRPDHAQHTRAEVGDAAVAVDELAPAERERQRVDGQVALGEVGVEAPTLERCDVDGVRQIPAVHAPGAERIGQREARGVVRLRQQPRGLAGVAVEREVDVRDRPLAAARRAARRRRPNRRTSAGASGASGARSVWSISRAGEGPADRRRRSPRS